MAQRVCPECGHVEGEHTFFVRSVAQKLWRHFKKRR